MRTVVKCIAVVLAIVVSSVDAMADKKYPFRGEVLNGYEESVVRARCDSMDLQPIEGLWYYPEEEMTVMIERCEGTKLPEAQDYRIVLVDSEDVSLLPGTVIGYCKPTADARKYKVWIYGEQKLSILENLQACLGELSEDASLMLIKRNEVKMRVRMNFTRFLPTLLNGLSVTATNSNDVKFPDGFRKIYPKVKTKNGKVRYL
jgi:hypothetical protein